MHEGPPVRKPTGNRHVQMNVMNDSNPGMLRHVHNLAGEFVPQVPSVRPRCATVHAAANSRTHSQLLRLFRHPLAHTDPGAHIGTHIWEIEATSLTSGPVTREARRSRVRSCVAARVR